MNLVKMYQNKVSQLDGMKISENLNFMEKIELIMIVVNLLGNGRKILN
jgi:hypothetical protein